MRSAAVCHAAADRASAETIARYLALNCPTEIHTRSVDGAAALLNTIEFELSADFVLVLLSPDSWNSKLWKRERWEDVLIAQRKEFKTEIAYLQLAECKFPELLKRTDFFDLSQGCENGKLEVRRWLLRHTLPARTEPRLPAGDAPRTSPPVVQKLESILAAPGTLKDIRAGDALRFARRHALDFEAAAWIDCAYRSRAGTLGDLAQALSLVLTGTEEQNAEALREYCARNRVLLIFENPAIDQLTFEFGGKASLLFTKANSLQVSPRSLDETHALFSAWSSRSAECLQNLRWVQFHVSQAQSASEAELASIYSLGFAAVGLLKQNGRLAEAHELLGWMWTAAFLKPNQDAIRDSCAWETSWIREAWDLPSDVPAQSQFIGEPEQLALFAESA